MDIIKCLKSFFGINERAKRIVATILCVSLVMVDTLPYYAENIFDDVANDAVTDFADTLLSTPSSAEEENEIVDEDIDEVGGTLFGANPVPPEGYFYLTYTYATRSETTPGEFVDVTKEILVKASTSVTLPTVIDFKDLPPGKRHFIKWEVRYYISGTTTAWLCDISNGGTLTAAQTNSLYNNIFITILGYKNGEYTSDTPPVEKASKRRVIVSPVYQAYCTDENELAILNPTLDDSYGIDTSEMPDEAKVDGKYAIYFYYDKDILGQDIPSNPIVATYGAEINFPTIDTSLVKSGCTFEGWMRDDITISSGGTLTAEQSKICTGVGTDKYVIFEAKMNVPELHTVHFDIDEEYYNDVIPPINNATSSVIKFPSFPNQLRGVEIASWKSSDGGYIFNPGDSVSFSALDWTNTNDYYFTPIFEIKDINIHFKNELPPDIPGTIPASRSDVVVRVNQLNPNEYQEYKIPGYKHEGWGLSSDGDIAIEVDKDNIDPLNFLIAGQLSYDMYPIFLPDGERPEPAPEEPKKRRYSSGGGSGGGVYYSDGASSGIFEFDPLLNKFKCYIFDKNKNKQYVVNDWFKIIDKKDGKAYWYLTDATGCMVTGWTLCDGVFYYFSESVSDYGMMANGTYNINGKEYVFTSDGRYVGDANLIPKVYNIVNRNIVANMSDTEVSAFNDTEVFTFADTEPTKPYIEYFDEDGNFISSDEEVYYNHYKDRFEFFVDAVAPAIDNYIFEGWEVIGSVEMQPKLYTADMKLGTNKSWQFMAKYNHAGYKVIYFSKEAGISYNIDIVDVSTISAITNYTITNRTPTKAGYTCIGFTDVLPATIVKYHFGETIAIHQDLNLYPVWEKRTDIWYISDMKLAYCDDDGTSGKMAREKLENAGYTVIDRDLNEHAGGKFIYLGIKTDEDPEKAITGIGCLDSKSANLRSGTQNIFGITYESVKVVGESTSVDLNIGAGGNYIYLYYTKDPAAGSPLIDLDAVFYMHDKKDENYFLSYGWNVVKELEKYTITDFNDGCTKEDSHYLYMIYQKEGDVINPDPYMDIKYVKSNNWMAKIPGDRLITHINTPGTHDSGTRYMDFVKRRAAQCQDLQIDEQLEAGVRFLDCRLGYWDKKLMLFHGKNDGPIAEIKECRCFTSYHITRKCLTLEMVLNWCINFVTKNPTETVFMQLKHETRDSKECANETNKLLAKYKSSGRLYMTDKIPMLSEVRGKVVVIDSGAGIDGGVSLSTSASQDAYGLNGKEKIKVLKEFFAKECNTNIDKLTKKSFIQNYTSCCNCDHTLIPSPRKQAEIVIPWFMKECQFVRGRYYGWIPMDFVTQEMAEKVYMSNFK